MSSRPKTLYMCVPQDQHVSIHFRKTRTHEMTREKRLRHYQRFLKSFKKPQPTRCSCTAHMHPRPWVPAPCRTTGPIQEETPLRSRRTLSNPEIMTNKKLYDSEPRPDWESDEESRPGQKHLRNLYKEARVLKEALNSVRHGNQLSKDTSNVVRKWSKKDSKIPPGSEGHGMEKGQKPHTENNTEMIEALNRSMSEVQQEEEALRQELQNMRKMAKSSSVYEEENKKLKKKIYQLQRRLKRQEKVPRASHESLRADRELGSRDEFLILSLKKKYEDLLQYVLKVEAENQKLKSLTGLSGEAEGLLRDSDREDAQYGPHVVTRLHHELEALRQELSRKDGHMVEYEQRLQAMEVLKEENISLHKTLRNIYSNNLKSSDERPVTADVEEEWMRRLAETREMYEQVVEGYKEKFEEMRQNMISSEEAHVRRTRELEDEVLSLRKNAVIEEDKTSGQNSEGRSPDGVDPSESKDKSRDEAVEGREERRDKRRGKETNKGTRREGERSSSTDDGGEARFGRGARPRHYKSSRTGGQVSSQTSKNENNQKMLKEKQQAHEKLTESVETSEGDEMQENIRKSPEEQESESKEKENCHSCTTHEKFSDTQKYVDNLNSLVERMEKVSVGGDSAEATLLVIREAINTCLKEWRDSFQQQQLPTVLERDSPELRKENEELQKKIRSRQKKLDIQHKELKDLESQNTKLIQKCSQLENQVTRLQAASDRFALLQDIPQILQDTEQKLGHAQAALQSAEAERQLLQDQVTQLGEKLNKKEGKLKNERDQNYQKEKNVGELKEEIGVAKRRAEELTKEASHLHDQLVTKDTLLERTSAQLEERIRECASLSSQIERLRQERNQDWDKIQSQISERDSATSKQYIEAQGQVARYQAQLSAMRSEKEQTEKSLRQHVRKLEEQMDNLQLRNSTMQRQLSTITSTYHNMFSTIDVHSPSALGIGGTSGMKDL